VLAELEALSCLFFEDSLELLERLAQSERPINIGAWSEDQADRAREAVKRSRESFER